VLEKDLGYKITYKIIDAQNFVPQHRERIYIVGFRDHNTKFTFPVIKNTGKRLKDILEKKVPDKYTLSDKLWSYLQAYAEKHKKKGNGFGYTLNTGDDVARTLSARYHKDGSEILIAQKGKNPRRLTPRECARLMGFPDSFKIPVSDTQAYHQFGNSIVVPVVKRVAEQIVKSL
jgi:DNA (cytosine-5)-methyltransferase 1